MPNPFRRPVFSAGQLVPTLLLCLVGLTPLHAIGQSTPSTTPRLDKQLERIDFYVGAAGFLSNSVTGLEQRDAAGSSTTTTVGGITTTATTSGTTLRIKPSTSVSEIGTIRYTAKPWVGFEFNFVNSRYTQNMTFTNTTVTKASNSSTATTTTNNPPFLLGGAQNNVHELTLGYVAHLRKIYGFQPYVGVGGGTMQFRPTPGGGQGLPRQFRAVYYYDLGIEDNFPDSHFGMRLGFRQLVYLAPDFGQNFLTITRRERTSEPTIGFFVRF
jgi:hypothetical protein